MVLFTPDGVEITRLPGEVDPDQYMRVLTEGMNGARPVKATLAAALAPGAAARDKLAPEDWRMLAYYSWITDEQQLASREGTAGNARAPRQGVSGRSGGHGDAPRAAGVGRGVAREGRSRRSTRRRRIV